MMEVTGIIMAGGKSSRMGTDKGLLIYKDNPMVTYPLEALKKSCNNVLISANNEEYHKFGFPLVMDEYKEIGPIGGLYSSLNSSKTKWNIVLACDMPFVTESFVKYLISEIDDSYDVIIPQNENNQFETLSAAYSISCFPVIQQKIASRKYSLVGLLNDLKIKTIQVSANSRNFINVNTLKDFNHAEKNL